MLPGQELPPSPGWLISTVRCALLLRIVCIWAVWSEHIPSADPPSGGTAPRSRAPPGFNTPPQSISSSSTESKRVPRFPSTSISGSLVSLRPSSGTLAES